MFPRKNKFWDYVASKADLGDGLILEFGVFRGRSINYLAKIFKKEQLFGFDSFEGLAEDWAGSSLPKGAFDVKGALPDVPSNVSLIKGWFDQTLPGFLEDHSGEIIKYCHLDCDTYESAHYVLSSLVDRFQTGTVIVFDEYIGYPNWREGEYKAWQSICSEHKISYEYIGFSNMQAAVVIK